MGGVSWKDKTRTDPCFPEFNALGDHVKLSKVFGISEAYNRASTEIIDWYNISSRKISKLETEISCLTKAENSTNVQYDKGAFVVPMSGRKPKALSDEQIAKARRMRVDGVSCVEIAKHFHVSDKTIRRYTKIVSSFECS